MRKNLTKKLFLSVLTLAFAVVSLGASTYAWFTMSKDADVEAFTADVKAGEGIEIAVTSQEAVGNAQWYTGVVPADVVQAAAVPTGFKFDAVSTADGKTFVDKEKASVTTGYISFYIHIKAAEAGDIKLNGITLDSKSAGAEPTNWTADAAYKLDGSNLVNVNDKVLYEVENAARVSLTIGAGNAQLYEKGAITPELVETVDGQSTYKAGNQTGQSVKNGAYDYYNAKNSVSLVDANNIAAYQATALEGLEANPQQLINLGTDQTVTIKVNVWIEGWDAECLNAIFAQTLSVAFSFTYVAPQA